MSIVKSNKFSPQSLPIVQIDGFNDVESFVVGVGQTSFTTVNFDNRTPLRAFTKDVNGVWGEITLIFSNTTTFEVVEGVSTGESFLVFYQGKYYANDETVIDTDIEITSTNPFADYVNLNLFLDDINESAFIESYKNYGLGTTNLQVIDNITAQSVNLETGIFILQTVEFGSGVLMNYNQGGSIKHVFYPFSSNEILMRDNSSGTFGEFQSPHEKVDVQANITSFTLALTDQYKYIRVSDTVSITVTVPTNETVAFPVGSYLSIIQAGAGQVSVVGSSGVTINTPDTLNTRGQFSTITLTKVGTDEWDIKGDLELFVPS